MRKSTAWYIKYPCDFYALGPVRFDRPVGEEEVRKYARNWSGVTRLPKGWECWPTSYQKGDQ